MTTDLIRFDDIDEHGPQTYSGSYEIPLAELGRHEVTALGPLKVEARFEKGHLPGEYIAEGRSSFTADLDCARCLEAYPFANDSSFHIRFRPRPVVSAQDEEVEISDDELDVEFYSEREIPLRDLAFEQIQLAIPMKTLCQESCLGLCPQCGADRNRETCKCESSPIDDRWGALQGIREQLAKKRDV